MKLFSNRLFPDIAVSYTIRKRLVYQLYHQTRISLTTLVVLTVMLFVFLKGNVPDTPLYTWFALTITVNLFRLADTYRFLHKKRDSDILRWRNRFAYKAWANAFLWGSSSILFLPYLSDTHLSVMIFIFIMGIAGGAVSAITFDLRIASLYLLLILMPLAFYFLIYFDIMGTFFTFLIVLYYVMLLNVCRISADAIINSYRKEEQYRRSKEELSVRQEELNNLFTQAPIGIFYFDRTLKIINSNKAFAELFQLKTDELVGMSLYNVPDKRIIPHLESVFAEGKPQYYNGPYHSIKGLDYWVEAKSSPIRNDHGEIIGGMTILENKTREKEALDELHFLANHDPLTALPNRRSLKQFMQHLVKDERHANRYSLLFYLDLNRFKQINDSLGHSIGDALLQQVAKRLGSLVGIHDLLCRLGGDEFIIVLPFVAAKEEESRRKAESFAETIRHCFREPFDISELHLKVNSSIGVVMIEPGSENVEEIIRHADISMYQAKHKRSGSISFYNPRLDEQRREHFSLQHDLSFAVAREELELYFQPIVKIRDDRLRAAEALLRWNHPVHGQLPPDRFLPLAEESGILDEIGWWVIDSVCSHITQWKRKGIYRLDYISINIDAAQLLTYAFEEKFAALLARHGVSATEIKIELTETSLIDNFEQTKETIDRLQAQGIRCVIDDFGTGYSSLSYLPRLNFTVLKIDRAFISDLLGNPKVLFLVKSIIDIGKWLGYRIVVEGIETAEQKKKIAAISDEVSYQGFLFSPPVGAKTFEKRFLSS